MMTRHEEEVIHLMGAIAHIQVIAANKSAQRDQSTPSRFMQSPYEPLLRFSAATIKQEFTRDFCRV